MSKMKVFKEDYHWVAKCNRVWTCSLTVCTCGNTFEDWRDAFDYAFKGASDDV